MNHDICAVFDRTNQIRCAECIIDDQRQSVLVGNFRQCFDIRNITVRISQGFNVKRFRILLNCPFYFVQLVHVHQCGFDAVQRKGVLQQVNAAAVNGLLSNDVFALLCQCLDGVGNCSGAGCNCQSGNASLQCGNSIFENALSGVGQSAVNVSRIRQTEAVCRVLTVMEYVRCGGVDWNGSRIAGRIRLFLSYVKLQCFEFVIIIVSHCFFSLF